MSAVARREPLDQFCLGGLSLVLPVVLLLYAYGYVEQHHQARRAAEVSVPACGADDWACELGQAYAGGWRPQVARRRVGQVINSVAANAEDSMLVEATSREAMKPKAVKIAILTLQHTVQTLLEQPSQVFADRVFEDEHGEKVDGLAVLETQLQNLDQLCIRLRNDIWGD